MLRGLGVGSVSGQLEQIGGDNGDAGAIAVRARGAAESHRKERVVHYHCRRRMESERTETTPVGQLAALCSSNQLDAPVPVHK